MGLFAERGYQSTTVGQIEQAAGLSPRAGAFYKHFSGKQDVLDACIDAWVGDIAAFALAQDANPDDTEVGLAAVAVGSFAILDRQRELFRFLHRDGQRFPAITSRVHEQLVQFGYRELAGRFARIAGRRRNDPEIRALAAIGLGSLVHHLEDDLRYGAPPADSQRAPLVKVWARTMHLALRDLAGDATASEPSVESPE